MNKGVIKVRALPDGLALPAGQAVALKPRGHHVMRLNLKRPLAAGEMVPMTLVIKQPCPPVQALQLRAPVQALGVQPAH